MTAKESYKQAQKEINKLMSRIEKHLIEDEQDFQNDPNNWGFAGEAAYIQEQLTSLVDFIEGKK